MHNERESREELDPKKSCAGNGMHTTVYLQFRCRLPCRHLQWWSSVNNSCLPLGSGNRDSSRGLGEDVIRSRTRASHVDHPQPILNGLFFIHYDSHWYELIGKLLGWSFLPVGSDPAQGICFDRGEVLDIRPNSVCIWQGRIFLM